MITRTVLFSVVMICVGVLNLAACGSRSSIDSGKTEANASSNRASPKSLVQGNEVLTTTAEKANKVRKMLEVIQKLSLMAASNTDRDDADPDEQTRSRIYSEVETIKNPDELVTLGRICRSILGEQEAGDVAYDKIFNTAFWHCVQLLAQDTSDDAVRDLNELWRYSNTDAGDSMLFKEAIADQKAKRRRK
jgi:hypothetical protein